MHIPRFLFPFRPALAGVLLAGVATTLAPLSAGEVAFPNGTFDDLAPAPAWSWENWSLAGSEVSYDAKLDAGGGAAGSGSLRFSAPFVASPDWREAVFTLDTPDFDASKYYSMSFDVKVDPASTPRAAGDYGNIQVILRDGNNWDWRQEAFVPLNGTEWQRVNVNLKAGDQPIKDLRAVTMRVAQSGMAGPVTVNVDNVVFHDDVVVANFDGGSIEGWIATWGTAPELEASTLDHEGRKTSGSLKVSAPYFDPTITSWQQAVITVPFAETNISQAYTHVNVDVKIDPSSIPTGGGNYGLFEIKTPSGTTVGGATLTTTEWTHLSFEITPSIGTVNGFIFQLGAGDMKGPVTYNLDNLTFSVRTEAPPPPTLQLAKAAAGLTLVHTASDQYGRHNIFTTDNSTLGWSDSATPTTYEFTLLSFPSAVDHNGFQAHLFLVPGTPGTETGPDWNEPNMIFLDVKANAAGANAVFRWKTNQANGNSQLYAGGLSNVNSATVTGTWKVTATKDSHFTVTAPDGATTTVDFDAETAALFAGPIRVYVGVQGNNPNNIGQSARIGGVKISQGATVLLADNFTGDALDETKWTVNAAAGGVQYLTAADAGYLVTWGLPDDGYVLQWAGSLKVPVTWTDSTATPVNVGPLRKQASIPKSELPPGSEAYFRLRAP